MAANYQIHRNRLIAGSAILVVLLVLVVYFLITLLPEGEEQAQVGQRSPLPQLTYCGAEQDVLCILSFTQEVDGALQVHFQMPREYFPLFTLIIDNNGQESIYDCKRVQDVPNQIYCSGAPQVPGQILQFKVISRNFGMLAEGKFAIIGIALVTPEISSTTTAEDATMTPDETQTAVAPSRTPTPVQGTPTPSTTPNPSYPNPSYP